MTLLPDEIDLHLLVNTTAIKSLVIVHPCGGRAADWTVSLGRSEAIPSDGWRSNQHLRKECGERHSCRAVSVSEGCLLPVSDEAESMDLEPKHLYLGLSE